MTPDQQRLELAGQTLFGQQWQSELARHLSTSPRTVRSWLGIRGVPAHVWPKITQLCADRSDALYSLWRELSQPSPT